MRITSVDGDICNAYTLDDVFGYLAPDWAGPDDLPALRFDGSKIIDIRTRKSWLIDVWGNKRLPSMHSNSGWQELNCFWDDALVSEAGNWRIETDADRLAAVADLRLDEIKQAVRSRIYAVASVETQMNMSGVAAFISSKTAANRSQAEKDHLSAYEASLNWVGAMRVNVATLAVDPNLDFTDDANWPVTPPEVIALAAQF